MNMKNNIIISTILLISFLGFVSFHFWEDKKDNEAISQEEEIKVINDVNNEAISQEEEIILFYGTGCPACLFLDNFIEEQGINEKVSYAHKEVYSNKENSAQLIAKAGECGLNTDAITIPFLWVDGVCYTEIGSIMNYFEEKIYD